MVAMSNGTSTVVASQDAPVPSVAPSVPVNVDSIATDRVAMLRTIPMEYETLSIDAPFTIAKGKREGQTATHDDVWAKMGSALHSLRPQKDARIMVQYDRVNDDDTCTAVTRKVLLVSVVTTSAGRYGTEITVKMARADKTGYDVRTFIIAQLRSLSYPARRA